MVKALDVVNEVVMWSGLEKDSTAYPGSFRAQMEGMQRSFSCSRFFRDSTSAVSVFFFDGSIV